MIPTVFDFPYSSQMWNSKLPFENLDENLPKIAVFCPLCKKWEWERFPKTKTCISGNTHATHIPTISPISTGGFLRIKKIKQKLPIGAIVKFSYFAPEKLEGGSHPN